MSRSRSVHAPILACLLIGFSLSSCSDSTEDTCSKANLKKTDAIAKHVWTTLDSSDPRGDAYCDSSPWPYAGGEMASTAGDLEDRAIAELGCKPTTVKNHDPEYSTLLACDLDGMSYMIELTHAFGATPTEVGVYKR